MAYTKNGFCLNLDTDEILYIVGTCHSHYQPWAVYLTGTCGIFTLWEEHSDGVAVSGMSCTTFCFNI